MSITGGTSGKSPFLLSIGDLVLTTDGVYRWAGEKEARKGYPSVGQDYRFNSVPSATVFRNEIAPAALEQYLDFADLRVTITRNKNKDPFSIKEWIGKVEGEDKWIPWGSTASEAIRRAICFLAIRDWHENGCPPVGRQSEPSMVKEMPAGSILEDFEIGQKVFLSEKESTYTTIGTVTAVECNKLRINLNGGNGNPAEIDTSEDLGDPLHFSQWRKLLDDTSVRAGDTLSTVFPGYLSVPNGREYFTVIKIKPGKLLQLQSRVHVYHSLEFDDDEYGSLDQYLQHWELEG